MKDSLIHSAGTVKQLHTHLLMQAQPGRQGIPSCCLPCTETAQNQTFPPKKMFNPERIKRGPRGANTDPCTQNCSGWSQQKMCHFPLPTAARQGRAGQGCWICGQPGTLLGPCWCQDLLCCCSHHQMGSEQLLWVPCSIHTV